jgi:hypothetical protein
MIPWRPIAELPDELKDGRKVLLWKERWAFVGEWDDKNGWTDQEWDRIANPTHFAEITPP